MGRTIFGGKVWPPFVHKIFRLSQTFWNIEGLPKIFRHWKTWLFWQKNVYTPNMQEKFPIPQFFWKSAVMNTKFFVTVRPKFFDGKKLYAPPPSSVKTLRNQKFSQKQWDSFTKVFGTVRRTIFGGKVWPPFMHKIFRLPQTFWNIEWLPTIFRHWKTWLFWQKNVYTPNMPKKFRYHNFSERVQGWTRKFSSLWDQNFSTEKSYTPPFHP